MSCALSCGSFSLWPQAFWFMPAGPISYAYGLSLLYQGPLPVFTDRCWLYWTVSLMIHYLCLSCQYSLSFGPSKFVIIRQLLLQPYILKVVSIDFILVWQESLKWICKRPQYRQKTGRTKDAYYDYNKDERPSSSSPSFSSFAFSISGSQSLDALSQWWAAMRGVIRYCKKISMGYNFQNGVIRQKNLIFLKTSWKFQHNGGFLLFKMD